DTPWLHPFSLPDALPILHEEIAREGVGRLNDYLRRNPQIRRTASLVVSKEKASKYMEIKPELEQVPSLYLAKMIDSFSELGRFRSEEHTSELQSRENLVC